MRTPPDQRTVEAQKSKGSGTAGTGGTTQLKSHSALKPRCTKSSELAPPVSELPAKFGVKSSPWAKSAAAFRMVSF